MKINRDKLARLQGDLAVMNAAGRGLSADIREVADNVRALEMALREGEPEPHQLTEARSLLRALRANQARLQERAQPMSALVANLEKYAEAHQ